VLGWGSGGDALFGEFLVVADGGDPLVDAEGGDVLVLGELHGSDESLAEIGEGGGGFGFDVALGDGGEEASEGGAEITGGDKAAGEVKGDVPAGLFADEGLGVFAGVEGAEVGMAVAARQAALAAIDKGEGAERGTVFLRCGGGTANAACGGRAMRFRSGRRAAGLRCGGTTAVFGRGRRTDMCACGRRAASGTSRHGSLLKERFGI